MESTSLEQLSNLRHLLIDQLIRANPRLVGEDRNGEPVVLHEILGLSPTEAALDRARSLGFTVDREQTLDAMNLRLVVFATPRGMSTMKALRTLRDADPAGSYDYNHIYTGSGEPSQSRPAAPGPAAPIPPAPQEACSRRAMTHPVCALACWIPASM